MAIPTAEPQVQTSFEPSALVDLLWAMFTAAHPECCDSLTRPAVSGVSEDEALAGRLAAFWDDGVSDFAELVLIGQHAGVLTGGIESETLSVTLDRACQNVPTYLPLRSEKIEDRMAYHRRLRALRDDHELRSSYIALVGDVWSAMEADWNSHALPAAAEVARRAAERVRRGRPWLPLFVNCDRRDDYLAAAWERASASEGVLIAVSSLGAVLMLDLPGVQLVGLRMATLATDARDMAAKISRGLRAVADPTRLLALELLAGAPRAVGELARELGVSQPTASNHVKILREAGVVHSQRSGPRSELLIDRGALDQLLAEVGSFVSGR